jgi:hypothetical protein
LLASQRVTKIAKDADLIDEHGTLRILGEPLITEGRAVRLLKFSKFWM